MGFDTIIVGFFVIGTIVVVACALTTGANNLIKTSYEGYTTSSETAMNRLHTNIKVDNITFDGTSRCFHLTVENTGETKLSNFNLWDVVVANNSQAVYLSKNDRSIIFTSDIINPGILDPHESIDMKLSPPGSGWLTGNLYFKVVTENGISSSINYTMS